MLIPIKPSKHQSFDPLIKSIRERLESLPDPRGDSDYALADAAMSALAMFSLKDPSLLAFEERRNDQNMKNIYRIENVPSDTTMREILDPVDLHRGAESAGVIPTRPGAGLRPRDRLRGLGPVPRPTA